MIFDSHMHSEFSTDSKMKIEDAIKVSKQNNIGIVLTEHSDLNYPVLDEFRCDVPKYLSTYEKYKSDSLLLGIEIGLSEDIYTGNNEITNNFDFDYVIGSIHSVNNLDIYNSYVNTNYSKKEFFQRYLDDMLACSKLYNNFDSLGHIDYLCRYAPFENSELIVSDYKDTIAEIIKTLLSKGKVLELNTARLTSIDAQKSLFDIYKLYKDLGAKHITIGSDAHRSSEIFRNFSLAQEIISEIGLRGIYFRERSPQYF
ncbi:MAG: histidinol phosphate phosphatase [Clostridium sp.]